MKIIGLKIISLVIEKLYFKWYGILSPYPPPKKKRNNENKTR